MRCTPMFALLLALASASAAAEFAVPGGEAPANVAEIAQVLRKDPYDLEMLVSFGTSKGGSAGHLALAIREPGAADDLVYSANFYADRAEEHAKDFYTAELMARIPKTEYLFATTSTLDPKAAFGLDFGEIYKRSVIGVRVYGVPAHERQALASFFARMNDDFRKRARDTEYHGGEIVYDYMHLNCAKTIGVGFKHGAGYKDLAVKDPILLPALTRVVAAFSANIPTEMTVKLLEEWNKRGYLMDVVLYNKYAGSPFIDPHEPEIGPFKDLPNRFPSVLSFDFRREQGHYEDYDNLYAMYLLYNLGKYSVRVDPETKLLQLDKVKAPMPYLQAKKLADESARSDSESYSRKLRFQRQGSGYDQPPSSP